LSFVGKKKERRYPFVFNPFPILPLFFTAAFIPRAKSSCEESTALVYLSPLKHSIALVWIAYSSTSATPPKEEARFISGFQLVQIPRIVSWAALSSDAPRLPEAVESGVPLVP
jgi:hypothetical protein